MLPRSIAELIRLHLDRAAIPMDEGGSQLFSEINPGYMVDEVARMALAKIATAIDDLDAHNHASEIWYGSVAAPTTTTAIDENVNRPYVALSGNNTWGPLIHVVGTEDRPVKPWKTSYAVHRIVIAAVSNATPFKIRLIYGGGTVEEAMAAIQWTETMTVATGIGNNIDGTPSDIRMRVLPVGYAVWAQVWNATNAAQLDFFVGIHGYPLIGGIV